MRSAPVAGIAGVWSVHSSLWNPAGRGGSTAGSTSFSWRPRWLRARRVRASSCCKLGSGTLNVECDAESRIARAIPKAFEGIRRDEPRTRTARSVGTGIVGFVIVHGEVNAHPPAQ